jgi:hypothetical protein
VKVPGDDDGTAHQIAQNVEVMLSSEDDLAAVTGSITATNTAILPSGYAVAVFVNTSMVVVEENSLNAARRLQERSAGEASFQVAYAVTVRSRAAADAVMHNAGRLVSDVGAAELTAALSTAFEQAGVEVTITGVVASEPVLRENVDLGSDGLSGGIIALIVIILIVALGGAYYLCNGPMPCMPARKDEVDVYDALKDTGLASKGAV